MKNECFFCINIIVQKKSFTLFSVQIVGLTASPGMGKAKSMKQAETNIKTLMANLDVTSSPTRVQETLENLRRFQNEADEGPGSLFSETFCLKRVFR